MSDLLFAMAFAKDQQNSHPRCLKYTTTSLSPVKGSFCISPELFKSVKFRIADALISLPLILATHALIIADSSPSPSAPKFASHSTSSHSPADVFVFPEDAEKNERRPFLLKTRGDDGEKTTAARANAARAPKAAAAVIVVVVVVVVKVSDEVEMNWKSYLKKNVREKNRKKSANEEDDDDRITMTDEERAAAAAQGKSPSKRGGGETLLFSCLVVLVSLFVVVDDAKKSLLAINNGIPSSSLSSSSKTTTNNNNNNHKYAFTPTNGKIRYSWVAKGHALPSERSGAKSDGAGSKEERDADEGSSSSSSFFSSEFKYMHMAMPTILPDGSIAVGAFVRYFCFSLSICVSFRSFFRARVYHHHRAFVRLRARHGLTCISSSSFLALGGITTAFQASPTEYEGSIRQALYWAISKDDGETFSKPKMIAKDDQLPVWTPVLKVSGKRVFLLYTVSSRKCRYYDQSRNALRHSPGGDVMYKVSDDNGKTWSSGQMILSYGSEDGMPKVIANTLVELEDGSWVLPFWREPGKTCPQMKSEVKDASLLRKGSAGVMRSADQGLTWEVFGNLTATKGESWLIENTVVERKHPKKNKTKKKNNVLVQHFRTKAGVAFVSLSRDNGKTWTEATETTLPNPNSKMHTVRIDIEDDQDDDRSSSKSFFVAAYNHHPRTRDPLVVAVSKSTDGIDAWKPFAKLEPGGMGEIIKPELDKSLLKPGAMQYAYPTVLHSKDGKYVFVAYSVMYGARGQLTCFGIRVARMETKDVPRP